jgi:phosphatidylethanolamine/phosphatidyl-N-methylethanolamine N-methyltransferase
MSSSAIRIPACCSRIANRLPDFSLYPKVTAIKQRLSFLARYLQSPDTVGALSPTSAKAIDKIVSLLPADANIPRRYVEVGAGTGVITKEILKKMKPTDHLDVVELNNKFYKDLKKKFSIDNRVTIHHADFLDWKPEYPADALISTLPVNLMTKEKVQCIYNKYLETVKPGGSIVYIQLEGWPRLRKLYLSATDCFLRKNRAGEFDKVLRIKDNFYNSYGSARHTIEGRQPVTVFHCMSKVPA